MCNRITKQKKNNVQCKNDVKLHLEFRHMCLHGAVKWPLLKCCLKSFVYMRAYYNVIKHIYSMSIRLYGQFTFDTLYVYKENKRIACCRYLHLINFQIDK